MGLFSARKVIHCMVDSKDFSEEKVKNRYREDKLPEADEVEAEGNAAEDTVLLYGSDDSLGYILGLEDGNDGRFHSVEHPRIYIIRSDGGDAHVALLLL